MEQSPEEEGVLLTHSLAYYLVILVLFLGLMLFLSFNKHSKDKEKSYHDVIWADAAGYYVYNPMWFIYGNNAANFPDSIDVKTGNGFLLDRANNSVYTKYPSGTALLESPFFLISHLLAKPLGYKRDGFSKIYAYGIYVSGVVYCFLAMFFLLGVLTRYFSLLISVSSILLFFVSTNLYYYTIDAPGMSHIYSFFILSSSMYAWCRQVNYPRLPNLFLFALTVTIGVLIRPLNILILLFPLFYSVSSFKMIKSKLRYFLQYKLVTIGSFLVSFLVFIPQLIYWKTTTGKLIQFGYQNEGFDFWKHPKLLEVWFSAMNGLFIYSPLVLLSCIGIGVMIYYKKILGIYIAMVFLLISYIFASWWNWWFGCSFGARSFVEYYSLLIIPFCFLWNIISNKPVFKILFFTFIALCCFVNLSIEYYYDGCFYGTTWDYHTFFKLIFS